MCGIAGWVKFEEAALAGEEEVRIRRELEENQRFFNQSRADVDVSHWSRMSYWTLDEAVALSLGKDQGLSNGTELGASFIRRPLRANSGRGAKLPFAS
jgi:hypothetical protein